MPLVGFVMHTSFVVLMNLYLGPCGPVTFAAFSVCCFIFNVYVVGNVAIEIV